MSIELVTPKIKFFEFRPATESEANGRSEYRLATLGRRPIDKLKGNGFFSDLSELSIRTMDQIAHLRTYAEGSVIFLEGDKARGIYILYEGRANVLTASTEGRTSILKTSVPGDVLGLSSVLAGTSHEVTVETVQPCQLGFVAREDFLRFVKQHSDACLLFAQHLGRDCNSAYEMIRSFRDPVSKRLARFLIACCSNGFVTDGIVRARLICTRETIAQRIGCSRETVSRTLSDFRRKGLAELVGTTLLVRDRSSLELITVS